MKTALERFNEKWKADENGCHVWTATKNLKGYGAFRFGAKMWRAHRWALQFVAGVELIDGLECDHLCNTPSCVNPAHLRQCTTRENLLAPYSSTLSRINKEKTHCPRGHELTGANMQMESRKRRCKTCRNEQNRKRRYAAKALKAAQS